jgi:hypothetical protein
MTQIKMVQPGTGIQQERKELARYQKGNIMGTKKRLESFHPSTHIK